MKRSGFTLMEVLVTLVVVTMFSAAVYSIFLGSVVDSRHVEQSTAGWRLGQSILRVMERDLTGCVGQNPEETPHFRASLGEQETARLDLVSSVDSRMAGPDGVAADLVDVTWRAEAAGEGQGFALYRSESGGEEVGEDGSAREPGRLLARGVKSFRLGFFDGVTWTEVWDQPALPLAVRVDLVLARNIRQGVSGPAREVEFPFRSVVVIPAGE